MPRTFRLLSLVPVFLCAACAADGGAVTPPSDTGVDARGDVQDDASGDAGPDVPAAAAFAIDDFRAPPAAYRPWVRWWWPGDDVEDGELRREVAVLAAAGFGGAEVQPFDAALDPAADAGTLARRRGVPSDAHTGHLLVALEAAAAEGLELDLTLGSGWPTGGAHVAPEDSMTTLVWSEHVVEGPATVALERLVPTKPPFYVAAELAGGFGERLARWLPDEARLVAVVAAKETGGRRSPVLFDLDDTVALDRASVVVLTDRVTPAGGLAWEAPAGTWRVVAFFSVPDGQYVQLAALPDPEAAYVVDHLDAAAVTASLPVLVPEALSEHFGAALRGLFVDSFELKTERFFTDDFLAEFARRRGYDLVPWLPAVLVPGADDYLFEAGRVPRAPEFSFGADDERVRDDYRRTVSELFVERFVETVAAWADARGLRLRIQAYGLDVDGMRAAGAAHIAEAEQLYAGGSELFVKLPASAAWLYGSPGAEGPLVSAESFVWMLRDHATTPLKAKAAADKLFAAGVNHVVFHGFPYAPPGDFGLYGWAPFSSRYGGPTTYSDTFGERTAFWAFLPTLNRYLARCQYLLRQGAPAVDLLVVYPWYGFPASLAFEEDYDEPLLGGWLPEAEPTIRELPFAALGALFGPPQTDPRVAWLKALAPRLRALEDRGFTWAWANAERLAAARVEDGAIVVGAVGVRAVARFELPATAADATAALATLAGDGALVFDLAAGAEDAPEIPAGLTPAVAFPAASPLRMVQRRLPGGGRVVFVRNPDGEPRRTGLRLAAGCGRGRWLDPWTGLVTSAEYVIDGARTVSLPPYGSRALLCGVANVPFESPPLPVGGDDVALADWALRVERADAGGGEITREGDVLGDWRDDEALRFAGGPATYATRFAVTGAPEAASLELGWVHGAVRVTLNGAAVGELLVPPFSLRLDGALREGENELVVSLVPPLRNHLVALAAAGDERYRPFQDREDTAVAAGVVGPATLRCAPAGSCEAVVR